MAKIITIVLVNTEIRTITRLIVDIEHIMYLFNFFKTNCILSIFFLIQPGESRRVNMQVMFWEMLNPSAQEQTEVTTYVEAGSE